MVRSTMSFVQLLNSFWGHALKTGVYILNNVPSKSVLETPYELWKRRKESLRHFRIWGCLTHMLVQNPNELENRSKLYLFVGYPKESRDDLFFYPRDNKVFVLTNITFLEKDHIRNHQPCSKLVLNEISKDDSNINSSSSKVVYKTWKCDQSYHSQEFRESWRNGRVVHQPDCYLGLTETHHTW